MTSTDRIEAAYHPFEGGSVPRVRKKQTTSSWLSPARFCLVVCFLLAGCIAAGVVYVCYTVAATFWQVESAPHLDKHANASLAAQPIPLRDANVVRSFFGPRDAGGIDEFDLRAALWVKALKPDVHWFGRSSSRSLSESPGCMQQLTWMLRRHSLGARVPCDGPRERSDRHQASPRGSTSSATKGARVSQSIVRPSAVQTVQR